MIGMTTLLLQPGARSACLATHLPGGCPRGRTTRTLLAGHQPDRCLQRVSAEKRLTVRLHRLRNENTDRRLRQLLRRTQADAANLFSGAFQQTARIVQIDAAQEEQRDPPGIACDGQERVGRAFRRSKTEYQRVVVVKDELV